MTFPLPIGSSHSYDAGAAAFRGIGICMKGKIRTRGKCLKCGSGWVSDGSTAPICECGTAQPEKPGPGNHRPGEVYVDISHNGRHRIFCDRSRRVGLGLEKQ